MPYHRPKPVRYGLDLPLLMFFTRIQNMKSASVSIRIRISIEDEQTGDVMNKKYASYQKQMLVALKWLDAYKYLFFVLLDGDFRPQSGEVV